VTVVYIHIYIVIAIQRSLRGFSRPQQHHNVQWFIYHVYKPVIEYLYIIPAAVTRMSNAPSNRVPDVHVAVTVFTNFIFPLRDHRSRLWIILYPYSRVISLKLPRYNVVRITCLSRTITSIVYYRTPGEIFYNFFFLFNHS
jgi:hypothetical protein